MKKSKKNKILNIIFLVSIFLLIASLIVGIILLLNKNAYATICFAGTFCSLILCIVTIRKSKEIESYENYYCEEYREEIENGKDIALSFEFKENYNPITDEFVADEFIKDENLRKMIWPENENKVFLTDDSEIIKIEDVKTKKPSELYAQRMHMSGIKYTCTDCPDCAKCKYAFDDYCTDGDCLMEK